MKILICGANGFIGSYITAYLLQMNYHVICCSRNVTQMQQKFPGVSEDVLKQELLKQQLS